MSTEFLPFATGTGANVEDQTTWASDSTRSLGFSAGTASSAKANKAIRQAAFVASGVANWLSNILGVTVADDGDLSGFVTKLTTAIAPLASPALTGTPTAPTASAGTSTTQLATTAFATHQDIGIGQTWQDVTVSRASGTTYTNGTGKPIQIVITASSSGACSVTLDSVSIPIQISSASYYAMSVASFIIPAGSTYSATGTFSKWIELR